MSPPLAATVIQGEALALVSKYSRFNLREPHNGAAHDLTFIGHNHLVDGALGGVWADGDYTLVGTATIVVTLHDIEQITGARVAQLRAERQRILAEARAKATHIDREIQSLLAIEARP